MAPLVSTTRFRNHLSKGIPSLSDNQQYSSFTRLSPETVIMSTKTGETTTTQTPVLLDKAPPPMPIVALVGLFAAIFVSTFPSWDVIDMDATIDTLRNRVFPDLLSLKQLGWIRCACAAFVFAVSFRGTFIDPGQVGGNEMNNILLCSILSLT